jgi:hypothetical protein
VEGRVDLGAGAVSVFPIMTIMPCLHHAFQDIETETETSRDVLAIGSYLPRVVLRFSCR